MKIDPKKVENTPIEFQSLETGELVTIINDNPLYIELSNGETLPYLKFIKQYKKVDRII